MAAANSQMEAFGGQRGQLGLEFETVSQRVSGLTEELRQTRQALDSKRHEESEAKNHLDSLRAEYATAIGKKGSLEAVIAEHGYSTESVRRLFQSGVMQGGMAPAGVLADFLEVENALRRRGRRFPARRTELHRGQILGRRRRRPAPSPHRRGRPGDFPGASRGFASQVFFCH